MKRTYRVITSTNPTGSVHTCEDVQIKPDGVKLLNGKGAQATIVAYYANKVVESIVEVTT
uniref:Uncharacterized protein n=3 Tax=unclassified bacterial viruses TaxID=12333 RepID=A0AAU6W113_9VIRU